MNYTDYNSSTTPCNICGATGLHKCPGLTFNQTLKPTTYVGFNMDTPCKGCGKYCTPCNSDCAYYSNKECNVCGFLGAHTCKIAPTTGITKLVIDMSLEELYDELGTLKWLGVDKGWDEAIKAVREHIKSKLV